MPALKDQIVRDNFEARAGLGEGHQYPRLGRASEEAELLACISHLSPNLTFRSSGQYLLCISTSTWRVLHPESGLQQNPPREMPCVAILVMNRRFVVRANAVGLRAAKGLGGRFQRDVLLVWDVVLGRDGRGKVGDRWACALWASDSSRRVTSLRFTNSSRSSTHCPMSRKPSPEQHLHPESMWQLEEQIFISAGSFDA